MTWPGRGLCAVALSLACAGAGCAGRRQQPAGPSSATQTSTAPRAASLPAPSTAPLDPPLQQAIVRVLSAPELARGTWGVTVESLDLPGALASVNADRLLLPSSTMKLVTLAAAATRLGWDHTFDTRLIAVGSRAGGELAGDLIVVGSGDPSLDDWDGAATRVFNEWAHGLKAAGISTVRGRLIGDATAFDDETLGAGWAWDDLDRSFAAEVSGLQFNQDSAQLTVVPAAGAGAPPAITVTPASSGLTFASSILTSAAGTVARVSTRRLPGSSVLELSGTVPAAGPAFVRNVSVPHPPLYFLEALRRALTENGIDIRGPTVEAAAPAAGTASSTNGAVVLSHRSPPLSMLAQTMMKLSQNLYAETLLKATGGAASGSNAAGAQASPATRGSWSAGLAEVRSLLDAWGIPSGSIAQVDGSGLSRYNYATPGALVAVLKHVDADPRLREPFRAALPIAGRDGTLEQRMRGISAERTVIAKTGSMSNARALAGYAKAANGESLAFAIIANNFGGLAEPVDRAIDAIVNEIASFSR